MSIADPTTIFGLDAPGLNQDEVAHAQGLAQQLPAKAARLRRAAQGVTDQNLAHGAGKIADFVDATAAGSPPDMQTAAKATADLVQAHPELFGSSTSEIVSMAQSTVVKGQIAVALIRQATDSVSTAAAVNATADAFGQTAAMIGAIAGAWAVSGWGRPSG